MTDRFIKYIPSEKTQWLRENHPNAFLLLSLIAERARRIPGNLDGLEIGECHIGDYKKAGISSRKAYRTALEVLIKIKAVEKIETRRSLKLKKSIVGQKTATNPTTEKATFGTKIKLLDTGFWDINPELKGHYINDHKGHQRATKGPRTRTERMKEKKEQPQTPSTEGAVVVFSCLQDLDLDEKYKFELSSKYDESVVIEALAVISESSFKRKGSFLQALRAACKGAWKPNHTSPETIEKNRAAAITLSKQRTNFHVCVEYLEIYHGLSEGGRYQADYIQYNMPHDIFMAKIEQKALL